MVFYLKKDIYLEYKEIFLESKKYLAIYLILILLMFISTFSMKNISHPKFEIFTLIIVAILGIFSILYYFAHNFEKDIYKFAFVIILCFGIMSSLVVPIADISDESEHLTRSEITSQGVFIPHWTGNDVGIDRLYNYTDGEFSSEYNEGLGFETINSLSFFDKNREKTVFETDHDTDKINYSTFIRSSSFEQNPFFGYLPQAFGIWIAKLLDLNVIWILWLGRICNLICYSFLISLAIKITPRFKIPLLAIACMPITIYQAASVSIDSMIFGLGLLTVAYFIYLHLAEENSIDIKKISIFTILCLLLGLCKLPYLAFIFLVLFIPRNKFQDEKNALFIKILAILIVSVIGILWSSYSTPTLMHSWRSQFNYVNSTAQIEFLINNPYQIVNFIKQIFSNQLIDLFNGVFNFYHGKSGPHYYDNYTVISSCLQLFLLIVLFAYPNEFKFNLKTKLGVLFVLIVVYVGTSFIQLLTWSYVGQINLGISIRYFIPLLALIPIILNFDIKYFRNIQFDDYTIVMILVFLSALILAFATQYY